MIRIGVRCDSSIELTRCTETNPRIRVCRMSPSETIKVLDICFNHSQRVEAGSVRHSMK